MDNTGYVTLTRQSGLMREMQVTANNLANMSTTGYRKEGLIYSEFVKALDGQEPSLSMATANTRNIDLEQGTLTQTGATYDFAIQGDGFFLIGTPDGERLTRAGSFTTDAQGNLVTPDGYGLLDAGGAPVFVPPDAQAVRMAKDGTLTANGIPLAQIGLWQPVNPLDLIHQTGTLFRTEGGTEPIENSTILQGYVEDSNVDPMIEISRMIDVQRAYEMGQAFLDREDQRIRGVIQTLGR